MEHVVCPVSLGELVDKIAILTIKTKRISDKKRQELAASELKALSVTLESLKLVGMAPFLEELIEINGRLWDIEDDIRIKEREKDFGEKFIELARAVYRVNDERFGVKDRINKHFGSTLKEVKSYESFE